jgi:outer membrane protein assembly factor BamB
MPTTRKKRVKKLLCSLFFFVLCNLNSEQLSINGDNIFVVSKFAEMDYFTIYTSSGEILWEVPFNSEIVSSQVKDDLLLIFSKARSGLAYFLTCLDMKEGKLNWEKVISAPNAPASN